MLTAPIRLGFYYFAAFAVIGIHMPFWPAWLAGKGLDSTAIGFVVAAGVGIKVIANPIVAHFADKSGERRRIMLLLVVVASIAFFTFTEVARFWSILVMTVVFFACWSPIMPLAESLTMMTAEAQKLDYGRVRMWGSASFIGGAVLAGLVLSGRSSDTLPWLVLPALALAVLSCALLPDSRAPQVERGRFAILELMKEKRFVLVLLSATCVQTSHAVYYSFGTIHWRTAGHSEAVIGMLWGESVIVEVLLFAFGTRLVKRFGAGGLIVLAGLSGIVRWTGTAMGTELGLLLVVQTLHALTFAAAHLGAIHLIARTVPPALSASAQSLYSSIVMGLGLGVALLFTGPLYGAQGANAFYWMTALAALGALLAWPLARKDRA